MYEIDIGYPKFTKLVQVRNFIHLFEFKGFFDMRRERTQSFNADCFCIVNSQPNHKVIWPRPGLNLKFPFGRRNSTSLLFLKSPKSSGHASGAWRHSHPLVYFLSGIVILTSLNDTSSPHALWTPALMLHLTNPCAKRKVLSLTKSKGKI